VSQAEDANEEKGPVLYWEAFMVSTSNNKIGRLKKSLSSPRFPTRIFPHGVRSGLLTYLSLDLVGLPDSPHLICLLHLLADFLSARKKPSFRSASIAIFCTTYLVFDLTSSATWLSVSCLTWRIKSCSLTLHIGKQYICKDIKKDFMISRLPTYFNRVLRSSKQCRSDKRLDL